MSLLLDVLGCAIAAPSAMAASYLGALTALSWRARPSRPGGGRARFTVVVPAHDEEAGITRTLESLRALDYPARLYDIVVVADNCTDRTAECAVASGVKVWERTDAELRGKGYALAFAFDRLLAEAFSDAIVVVDADTVVSANLLRAFDARLSAGATALQADYLVRRPRTARQILGAIAFAASHSVRSIARERLGLSVGLHGNGMCFATSLLRAIPYRAFSLAEDLEYACALAERGCRVGHVPDARVESEMPSGARASGTQRLRWQRGRRGVAAAYVRRLLRGGGRDVVRLDAALELLVPPLALLAAWTVGGLAVSLVVGALGGRLPVVTWLFAGAVVALAAHVLRAWTLSGTGVRGLAALAWTPAYVAWRALLALSAPRSGSSAWVRTAREGPDAP